MPRLRWLVIPVCLLLGAALAACGKKGDPEPPIRMVPAGTDRLSVVQRGGELLLELPYPQTTAAGTPLPRVSEVAVWQLVWPVPAGAAGAPEVDERRFLVAATPVRVVAEDELPEVVRGDRIALSLPVPEPPEAGAAARPAVTLAVKTAGPGGEESAFSNRVSFLLTEPPEPPTGLDAEGLPGGVRLEWSHPAGVVEEPGEPEVPETAGEPGVAEEAESAEEPGEAGLAGFNVYRRKATERTYGPPLRTVGPGTRTFTDEGALFGERYIYAVTAVASRQPVVVESRLAEEVEVDYRDLFPPPVPEGLVALAQEGRVRLVWEASEAPDLAGYRVYRRSPDTQEFRPLTEEPIAATEYQDRDLASGATYSYRVTAVDRSGNESEPSEAAVAVIR